MAEDRFTVEIWGYQDCLPQRGPLVHLSTDEADCGEFTPATARAIGLALITAAARTEALIEANQLLAPRDPDADDDTVLVAV